MRLLLDTRFISGDTRMSGTAQSLIVDPANEKLVSSASLWEMAIKFSAGKLLLTEPYEVLIPRELQQNGFPTLTINLSHLVAVSKFPYRQHRDPLTASWPLRPLWTV